MEGGGREPIVVVYQKPRGKNNGGPKDIAPTLTKCSYEQNNVLVTDARIRKLTPRECFRLQGFPDEYFDRAAAVNSDSQLYKQAGNAVTVNVIYEIAKRFEEDENGH
jgi:DNA (cytosine-5)-methyltransferase 1